MRLSFFLLFCFHFTLAQSTESSLSAELEFGKYLLNSDLLSDAELHFSTLNAKHPGTEQSVLDSLNYYLGWTEYRRKKLAASASHLSLVSESSAFHKKAQFFSSFNSAFIGDYASAEKYLQKKQSKELYTELKHFQRAGIALLQNDLDKFESVAENFTYDYYAISTQEENLFKYAEKMKSHPKRSPWMAGFLSAIVPGAGKIYAGKLRQGVASLLPIAALGLQTWENGRKRGWDHPLTIAYTGLFSIFYIGNIWGSTLSVKIVNDEFKEDLDQRILFDLHIPLRTIFP